MAKAKKIDMYEFKGRVEDYLECIVSSFQEEEAAERITNSSTKLKRIAAKVNKGTNFRLAVREMLAKEVEQMEDDYYGKQTFPKSRRYEGYDDGNYSSYYLAHHF